MSDVRTFWVKCNRCMVILEEVVELPVFWVELVWATGALI